ncbi:glycosyltransferase [Clostridium oceanicum]|uniref:Glycosyltransferase family 2 protein n=1 Tax=Clostridium oceanicum TaxID=1543 RepID=A0ABP3V059_9CLOT
MSIFDYLFIYCLISIWLLLLINIILSLSGYRYYIKNINNKDNENYNLKEYPSISILVPAHNEEKVIERTVRSLLVLDYPKEKFEVIVINDNSSDNTEKILKNIKSQYKESSLKIITTTKENGGKGKSNALNIGYKNSKGEYIVVYDADNTPEKKALYYLMRKILKDEKLAAVIGKFRTRNKKKNILTKFINIETLSFQWMCQAGRCQLLNLCTIPGTNFILRKSVVEKLGGWDINAIAEDTEISFRIYEMGYRITFEPLAVTWEQEPETLKVWFKQRSRWAKGNVYVLIKNIKNIFKNISKNITFDIIYFFSVYFLFLSSVVISDVLFLLRIFSDIPISISSNFNLLWLLAYILFVLEISITLAMEKGESNFKNICLVFFMYFTYCQLWMVVAINGLIQYTKDKLLKKETKWYKTERY